MLQSWIGTGANLPISGEQLASVLGQGTLSQLGSQVGAAPADVAQQLSQLLPGLVDAPSPQGQMPQGGLGSNSDLMGVLGQFFALRAANKTLLASLPRLVVLRVLPATRCLARTATLSF